MHILFIGSFHFLHSSNTKNTISLRKARSDILLANWNTKYKALLNLFRFTHNFQDLAYLDIKSCTALLSLCNTYIDRILSKERELSKSDNQADLK